jgi:hypothetical protein
MIQGHRQKQKLLPEPTTAMMATAALSTICYLNKTVISLDDKSVGYIIGEQQNNKMIIITDDSKKDKFIIPSCKVISVDKRNANNLIVDIEYHEAGKDRIVE